MRKSVRIKEKKTTIASVLSAAPAFQKLRNFPSPYNHQTLEI